MKDNIRELKDFPENYELVTNSQDITEILDSIGVPKNSDFREAGFLMVTIGNAEYCQIWACIENSIPWSSTWLSRVYTYGTLYTV